MDTIYYTSIPWQGLVADRFSATDRAVSIDVARAVLRQRRDITGINSALGVWKYNFVVHQDRAIATQQPTALQYHITFDGEETARRAGSTVGFVVRVPTRYVVWWRFGKQSNSKAPACALTARVICQQVVVKYHA